MKQFFGVANVRRKFSTAIGALICSAVAFGNAYAEVGNPRVNQVGYAPNGSKLAVYKTDSIVGQTWQLKKNGTLIVSGNTVPLGNIDGI